MKIDARLFPIALNGALGYSPHGRDLKKGETAKVLQIYKLGEGRIQFLEFIERIGDAGQFPVIDNAFLGVRLKLR